MTRPKSDQLKRSQDISRAIEALQRLAGTDLTLDQIISLFAPADDIQVYCNQMFNSPANPGYDSELSGLQAAVARQQQSDSSSAAMNTAINHYMQGVWVDAGKSQSSFKLFSPDQTDQIAGFFAPGSAAQPMWSCGATGADPVQTNPDGSQHINVGPYELAALYNLVFTELDSNNHARFVTLVKIGRLYKAAEDAGDEDGMAQQRTNLVQYLTTAYNNGAMSPALNFTDAQVNSLLGALKEARFKDLAPVAVGSAY